MYFSFLIGEVVTRWILKKSAIRKASLRSVLSSSNKGNKLTVTDQAEYVNPVGTLKTTVKANEKASTSEKAVEVSGEQLKAGITVTDTITYEGLVANKVYSVTGELYEVKDGKVVGTAKATQTKEFTVSEKGNGEWVLDFGKVTGLEANKKYVVYETATSKENLVDKDNTPEEKHVVEHKDPNDKAQTVVTTPEVPKEKEVVNKSITPNGNDGKHNSVSNDRYFPKTGESYSYILSVLGSLLLLLVLSVTMYMQYIRNKYKM